MLEHWRRWMITSTLLCSAVTAFAYTDTVTLPSVQDDNNAQALQESEPLFLKWFNRVVVNDDEVLTAARELDDDYNAKIKDCQQGTYNYPSPSILTGHRINHKAQPAYSLKTVTIKSLPDDICQVTTIEIALQRKVECNYTQTGRKVFSMQTDTLYPDYDGTGMNNFVTARNQCVTTNIARNDPESNVLRAFAAKLKKCIPGTYANDAATVTLSGYINGKCNYKSIINLDDKDIITNCLYSQDSLDVVVNHELAKLDGRTTPASQADAKAIEQSLRECDKRHHPF